VFSTINKIEFHFGAKISLEDKVYLETYYHHSQDDIEVDETPPKNTSIKSLNSKLDFD